MAQSLINEVSYLIGYRQSTPDRKTGLQFVLNWLYHHFPELEVILIEQDANPGIDFTLPPNCRHHFIFNPGLYNRCWAFNVGVGLTHKEILVFADSDMFLHPQDYLSSFQACKTFEAVNPNGQYTYNVVNTDADKLTYEVSEIRKLWTYAAGIMMMQRKAFERIGGWDERFEGWGVEDNEISHVIFNCLSHASLNFRMYHVDHARGTLDGKSQPNYIYNRAIFDEISLLHGRSVERYLEIRRNRQRGHGLKYQTEGNNKPESDPDLVLACVPLLGNSELKDCLTGWARTRSARARWTLIISNPSQTREGLEFLNGDIYSGIDLIILDHPGETHIFRYNSIIRQLEERPFDLCFFIRESLQFLKPGWDVAYHQVVQRTGLGHFCFLDKRNPKYQGENSVILGDLENIPGNPDPMHALFTITPAMIREVGYLDSGLAGDGRFEFLDFSLRSIRKGFNVEGWMADHKNSSDFFRAEWGMENRIASAFSWESVTSRILALNAKAIRKPRGYISFNDRLHQPLNLVEQEQITREALAEEEATALERSVPIRKKLPLKIDQVTRVLDKGAYKMADSRIRPEQGFTGIMMGLLKKSYNLAFGLRLNFLIRFMDRLANLLIRAGMAFKNIDYK